MPSSCDKAATTKDSMLILLATAILAVASSIFLILFKGSSQQLPPASTIDWLLSPKTNLNHFSVWTQQNGYAKFQNWRHNNPAALQGK